MTIAQPNPYVTLDPATVARAHRKLARRWTNANESAPAPGGSVGTVHRLRRGLIPEVEPLLRMGAKYATTH